MKTLLTLTFILFLSYFSFAQTVYVSAVNGLNVRKDAKLDAPKVGKFFYADPITILARNYTKVVVTEGDKRLDGNWIRVSGINEDNELLEGYVFDAYTTEVYVSKPLKIDLKSGKAIFKNADGWMYEASEVENKIYIDSNRIGHDENVLLSVDVPKGSKVEVFQRVETSVYFSDEITRCEKMYDLNLTAPWEKLSDKKVNHQYHPIVFTDDHYDMLYQEFWRNAKEIFGQDCDQSYDEFLKTAQTQEIPFSLYPLSTQFKIKVTDAMGNVTIDIIKSYEVGGC